MLHIWPAWWYATPYCTTFPNKGSMPTGLRHSCSCTFFRDTWSIGSWAISDAFTKPDKKNKMTREKDARLKRSTKRKTRKTRKTRPEKKKIRDSNVQQRQWLKVYEEIDSDKDLTKYLFSYEWLHRSFYHWS